MKIVGTQLKKRTAKNERKLGERTGRGFWAGLLRIKPDLTKSYAMAGHRGIQRIARRERARTGELKCRTEREGRTWD